MVQVTLQFSTIAAALTALAQIDNPAVVIAPQPLQPTTVGKQTPAPTPAPTTAPAASTTSSQKPSASPAQAANAGTTGEAAALDYEKDVKPIVIKVGAAGKRDNLVELLKKYGVAKGPEVTADKLPAFKADLEALLA